MGKRKLTRFIIGVIGIVLGVALVSTVCYSIPQLINYQGYLTDSGGNPLNGTVDMVFSIYDVDAGGSPLWTETQTGVPVTEGLFSVNMGEVTPITLPFDVPYWLGVQVGTDPEMTPRPPITSVGYAYRAAIADAVKTGGVESYMLAEDAVTADKIHDGAVQTAHLDTGAVTSDKIYDNSVTYNDILDGPGSFLDADTLDGYNSGDFILSSADNWVNETGDSMTGKLDISVASGDGLSSITTASSSTTYGVWGQSNSTSGRGVLGYAYAFTGTTYGVWGLSNSSSGRGVYGDAWATTGTTYGVYGESDSTDGRGVFGYATASSGMNYGVLGQSASTSGYGVYGIAPTYGVIGWASATTGTTYGVGGYSQGTDGRGVYGYASASATYGVFGQSASSTGRGVYGYASAASGNTYGVSGESNSTSGFGVRGVATASTGWTFGVYGRSESTGGEGVLGIVTATSGFTNGVRGESASSSGRGVYGSCSHATGYDFYAGGAGINYGPFTGAHEAKLAENFPLKVEPGLIVTVTGQAKIRQNPDGSVNISSTLPTVKLADTPHDKAVFGVLVAETTLPEDHWYEAQEGERFASVNALGEGRVWVADINGTIEAGDYITTSSIPGYGQKQDDDLLHSYTLGKATETVDWDTVSEMVEIDGTSYKVYLIAVVYTSG